jgi:hypothetical protein
MHNKKPLKSGFLCHEECHVLMICKAAKEQCSGAVHRSTASELATEANAADRKTGALQATFGRTEAVP